MSLKPSTNKQFESLEEGKYALKLVAIEDAEPGQFGPRVKWIFNVKPDGGSVLKNMDGSLYEWWQFSSENMGPKSTARKWAQALLGRELGEGEDVADELVGKSMSAMVGPNDRDYTTILSCKSVSKAAGKKPAPEPEPEPEPEPADDDPF